MGVGDLLVVEDDAIIGAGLQVALDAQGYRVSWCVTGAEAVGLAAAAVYDLVLLDLGLPDLDGVDVCQRLRRAHPALTIVMLTARDDEEAIIGGLDAGADDYLTKPFRLDELLARIRAHRRRPVGARASDAGAIELGGLLVDADARRVWVDGTEIGLRAKEFDLLHVLAGNVGQALTREQLMCTVWESRYHGSTKTLDMHVSTLRRKLGPDCPVTITTLRGVGYRLEVP